MEKNCGNCLHCGVNGKDTRFEPCKSCDGLLSNFVPKQPAREPQEELVTVPIILPIDLRKKVDALAAQCGLTSEQMASAMIVIAFKNVEPVEPEPPKPSTISINGVEVKVPSEIRVHSGVSSWVVVDCGSMQNALAMKAALEVKK